MPDQPKSREEQTKEIVDFITNSFDEVIYGDVGYQDQLDFVSKILLSYHAEQSRKLVNALENIIKHVEIIAQEYKPYSAIVRIAEQALAAHAKMVGEPKDSKGEKGEQSV